MKHLFPFGLCTLFLIGCAVQTGKGNVLMEKDDQAIRQWFERWMKATKEGDLQLAKSLIADDAVFLVPGADRMDKESFATAATATDPNTDFELDCSIRTVPYSCFPEGKGNLTCPSAVLPSWRPVFWRPISPSLRQSVRPWRRRGPTGFTSMSWTATSFPISPSGPR